MTTLQRPAAIDDDTPPGIFLSVQEVRKQSVVYQRSVSQLYGRSRQPLSLVEYVCIPVVGHACDIEVFSDVILSPN